MIEQSKYMPKQMNGPILNAAKAGLESRLTDAQAIESYLYNLSIQTAEETELENIGKIIGYPRPLVPEGKKTLPSISPKAPKIASLTRSLVGRIEGSSGQ